MNKSNFNATMTSTKTCIRCGDTKNISQFQKREECRDGRSCTCNACRYSAKEKKAESIQEMMDDLMHDPEAKELLKGLQGYGSDL